MVPKLVVRRKKTLDLPLISGTTTTQLNVGECYGFDDLGPRSFDWKQQAYD